jgi:antirestriction protein ArdC
MKIAELYRSVTQSIIRELEQGAAPWVKPWKGGAAAPALMPVNAATGHRYRGINVPILWGEAAAKGYPTHAWMTFKQAVRRESRMKGVTMGP